MQTSQYYKQVDGKLNFNYKEKKPAAITTVW